MSAHITNGRPTVVISDNGCGMDEETQKNIFNKFYRLDDTNTKEGNGRPRRASNARDVVVLIISW